MFELCLVCPQDRVDAMSDALDALGALSVSVEDADAQTDAEQALFGEPDMPPPKEGWLRSRVSALFASQILAQNAMTGLKAHPIFDSCGLLGIQAVPEQDWVRLTQSQFAPVEITPEFWVVPSWHQAPAQARIVLRLDPGLAFGTGSHATTRMCLRWIALQVYSRPFSAMNPLGRVLDYGCGSGILAIAAAKHGAREVVAVDIDEAAIQATVLNAQANQVHVAVGLPIIATGVYQTVLANILASPLKTLAAQLGSLAAPQGSLVSVRNFERPDGRSHRRLRTLLSIENR